MLKEGLIKLHYINPMKLSLKYSDKKLKTKIYGYNKKSVFTIKNLNSPDGDKSYRSQLKIPKVFISILITSIHFYLFLQDYISTLATESGGSVFTQETLKISYKDNKLAASILGRVISKSAQPNTCQVTLRNNNQFYKPTLSFRFVIASQTGREKVEWFAMNVLFNNLIWLVTTGIGLLLMEKNNIISNQ